MLINQLTIIKGMRVILVPYRETHVQKYHEWMKSEELQKLTASEPLTLEAEYEMQQTWLRDEDKCTFIILDATLYNKNKDEVAAMIGDVNLFLAEDKSNMAEVEIMIAEPDCRGKGMGKEAALLMMRYGADTLQLTKYSVKIGYDNEKSIGMFKGFEFTEVSRSDVFQEVTMELDLNADKLIWLKETAPHFEVVNEQGSD